MSSLERFNATQFTESGLPLPFCLKTTTYDFTEMDLLGDMVFTVGVPAEFPEEFKKMVFAAAKTYVVGNKSVDHLLKQYGKCWNFSTPTKGHYPLYLDIVKFVKANVGAEIDRFSSIPKKANHHGLFASGSALLRLQTSFSIACLLLREKHWLELACIEKLILEQISWSYAVRYLEGKNLFNTTPTNSIKFFKQLYQQVGQIYGLLNELAHISPEKTIQYLEISNSKPQVILASAKQTAKCAYLLLFLTDMFQACSEYVHQDYYEKFSFIVCKKKGLQLNPKRKTAAAILKFRKKLFNLEDA